MVVAPEDVTAESRVQQAQHDSTGPAVALIGMAGRFPGVPSDAGAAGGTTELDRFWGNLVDGVDSVSHFAPGELAVSRAVREQAGYVGARSVLPDVDRFDAAFFGIYPKEAEQMDPQHRVFLECCWEALERAGHGPELYPGLIGVFAGCSMNTYFMHNLVRDRAYLARFAEGYQSAGYTVMLGNDKDFLPTRVSYKLNLRGPSVSIQTACSTSLVAIAQACQSLLTFGCDMALAGGVSITFPQQRGYVPEQGGILSGDGVIRPFDKDAKGTVFGHGAGVVVLKRLDDAVADGDDVLAVIKGFALNNDGSSRAGYTAPSELGQAEVIAAAQAMAGFDPATISYVEAHGTGTELGDPVEFAGLTRAFRAATEEHGFCDLGTAKGNVGHLDVASGVVGLIKTVLQMQHRTIPGLLHFRSANPALDVAGSPFRLSSETRAWTPACGIMRAGVSSFGVGGTNAHLVVEQAPDRLLPRGAETGNTPQVLVLSAKTESALAAMEERLAGYLEAHPEASLRNVAHSLQVGRNRFAYRRAVAATSTVEAAVALRRAGASTAKGSPVTPGDGRAAKLAFLFPGQGAQVVGMGRAAYDNFPVFREQLDAADGLVRPFLPDGLTAVLYPSLESEAQESEAQTDELQRAFNRTAVAQPAIFAVSYALARLWQSLGVEPGLLIGHSIGEFVAAVLAGTLSFEDGLRLVAARGAIMQKLPGGAMLAIRGSLDAVESHVQALLPDEVVDLAAVNGAKSVVLSGTHAAIDRLAARLSTAGIASKRLATSHAFHSRMMDPVAKDFAPYLAQARFHAPRIPWISTLTGELVDGSRVVEPEYWIEQLRAPVQFRQAANLAATMGYSLFLEVGLGQALANFIKQNALTIKQVTALTSLGSNPTRLYSGSFPALSIEPAMAQLWAHGLEINWQKLPGAGQAQRVALPTYPFERKSYWVAPPDDIASSAFAAVPAGEVPRVADAATHDILSNNHTPAGRIDRSVSASISLDEAKLMSDTQISALVNNLKAMVTELSDLDLSQTPSSISLLELGLDSLFLTQLTQAIRAAYGVKLTFRQIMGEYATFDALAAHLLAVAAKEKLPQVPAPAPAVVSAARPGAAAPAMEAAALGTPAIPLSGDGYTVLFAQQMAAMNALFGQQLAILAGSQTTASAGSPQSWSLPGASLPAMSAAPAVLSTLAATAAAPSGATAAPLSVAVTASGAPEKEFGTLVPLRPLDLRAADVLTPRQEAYIGSLMARYNQRTARSKAHAQKYRGVLADPRVASGFNPQFKELVYPIAVERSKGAYLWDVDGNQYIDILNGYGSIFFGHSPDFVTESVRRQLDLGFPIGPQTELAGECAELMTQLVGMERATFCNTGSEAVMAAMRLARTVTGRSLIVLFAGAYHGQIDEVLVKSNRSEKSIPTSPGIPNQSVANMLVLEYGTPQSLEVIRRRADEIAAVLVEPIQSRHPELRPQEFLTEIRAITEEAGAALIFDEVVTGFRTHLGGAQQVYGIRADMATYGKVVAGGMPVGVVAGSRTYMDALDGGAWQFGDDSVPQVGVTFFAGTFVRHPLTMAAVKATLTHLRDQGTTLQAELAEKTTALVNDLNAMFQEFGFPAHIQHFASWFFFSVPVEARLAKLLYYHLREQGLHLQEGFPCFLTTAHTSEDLKRVREVFRHVLGEMREHEIIGVGVGMAAIAVHAHAGEVTAAGEAPITEAQREILLASQLGKEASAAFNESVSLHLDGALDSDALRSALEQVVARHEALRLAVAPNGESVVVARQVPVVPQEEDWRGGTLQEQAGQMTELLAREAATAFDLKQAPLFRATLVRLADEKSVLVFTGHHIIVDGWSINVLFEELGAIYSAAKTGEAAKLLPVHSFLAQAKSEGKAAKDGENAETEAFWLSEFRTLPAPLELPTDRPRGALREHAGSTFKHVFPTELVSRLRASSAASGNTLFSTLLSGYALLLSRLTGQNDVVVGIPMAGQRNFGGESFIGHAVNFLPIRVQVSSGTSFAALTTQVKEKVYDALDHQDYTLGTLVRKLKVPRNPARLELVEAQFNLEQVGAGVSFAGLKTRLEANPKAAVNADLFCNFIDRGATIAVECDYNTGLFDEATIARWIGSLETMLGDAASTDRALVDHKPASALAWVAAGELEQMVIGWNRTATPYPEQMPVHGIFEQQAERTPAAVALRWGSESTTYAELNEQANRFARFLKSEHGVEEDLRIALSLDREHAPELMVAILGVLKAGGVYIPIDPAYPEARIKMLLEDAEPTLLLTQKSLIEAWGSTLTPTVRAFTVEELRERLGEELATNLRLPVRADSPAYIIYTSGSTGKPKGVVVPHRAITRLVLHTDFIHFGPEEVFLQLAPVSFDASTLEIWGALLHGSTLALMNSNKPSPEEIGAAIAGHGVTTLWLTAALFHLMVMDHLPLLAPLKQLLAGGDVLSVSHVRKVLEAYPDLRLVNGYGPTENTTFTCCHTITLASLDGASVPIGRPIANTRIYILDSLGAPVPIGVPGSLHAAGDGLALGYWHAPELTAEKFIEAELPLVGRERLYRTGDTARYRADGLVEFQGRTDSQVKIRGFRVELGEIEAAAERFAGVRAAVVAARPDWSSPLDIPGDKRLAMYVLLDASVLEARGGGTGWKEQLREYLRAQLPDHMLPAAIMEVAEFPRTANGKIDYRALPTPEAERNLSRREVREPRTALEGQMTGIWSKVLQVDGIGVDDSIFELGGDSLSIFRITTQANQAGIRMTAKHLFQYKTVALLCSQLEQEQASKTEPAPMRQTIRAVSRNSFRRVQSVSANPSQDVAANQAPALAKADS